jgi:hypothetical protein
MPLNSYPAVYVARRRLPPEALHRTSAFTHSAKFVRNILRIEPSERRPVSVCPGGSLAVTVPARMTIDGRETLWVISKTIL